MSRTTLGAAMLAGTALALLAGCDRSPRNAVPPKPAVTDVVGPAPPVPASPGTVALSGAITDMPASTTPDARSSNGKISSGATTGPWRSGGATAAAPPSPSASSRSTSPPVASSSATPSVSSPTRSAPPPRGESQAMRDFRLAQERRDRELLERDLDHARSNDGRTAEVDRRDDDEALARNDGLDEEMPPEDDAPPAEVRDYADRDSSFDEGIGPADDEELPPEDDELPPDEGDIPPDDGDLQWDPDTQSWR